MDGGEDSCFVRGTRAPTEKRTLRSETLDAAEALDAAGVDSGDKLGRVTVCGSAVAACHVAECATGGDIYGR